MLRMVGFAAAFSAALLLGATVAGAAGDKDKKTPKGGPHAHAEHFDKCAKACNDCQRMCDACSGHCAVLAANGKKAHLKTLKTCQDCAVFCSAAAQIVARGGPFADLICKSCADACNRCGKACAEFKEEEMMRRCAEECFRCEKACREMLHHVGHDHPATGKGEDK